jgi:periplasmic protein TonB
MVGVRQSLKIEPNVFSATFLSLSLHFAIAGLLFCCLKESRLLPLQQSIIMVDIREIEPAGVERSRVSQPPHGRPSTIIKAPTAHIKPVQTQLQKPVQLQARAPSPAPSITPATEQKAVPPFQESSDSMENSLSAKVGPNTAAMVPPVKNGVQPRREEALDVHAGRRYLSALKEIIERHKEYPLLARRGRMEGTVRINCKLTRTGEVREAKIESSSGYDILDKAALRSVRSVGQFPVVPTEIEEDPFCFVAPITFHLSRE